MKSPDGDAAQPDPEPRQIEVYRKYLRMQVLAEDRFPGSSADCLAGRLSLCVGFGQKGAELALATTLAGGTFLGIDPAPERLKAAVRNGSCDFMVTTLDESLRTLKNEIRKRTALSVGLLGRAFEILPAMVERGVQPDLIADASPAETGLSPEAVHAFDTLVERGAWHLDAQTSKSPEGSPLVEVTWTAANAADLKRMDSMALEYLPAEDAARRRWLLQAAGCFHRQRPLRRVLSLAPEEFSELMTAFQDAASKGKIQTSASIQWHDATGVRQTILLQRR